MKDWKGTKGEWLANSTKKFIKEPNALCITDKKNKIICKVSHDLSEVTLVEYQDNVTLICDAGNTIQKSGLLPSEILEQRDELINLVIMFRDKLIKKGNLSNIDVLNCQEVNELINKITE